MKNVKGRRGGREGFVLQIYSPRAAPILRRLLRWDTVLFTSTRTKNIGISCARTIHRESKKGDTILLSISLLNIDRFS